MKMNAEQLQGKWDEVIQLITDTFDGERRDNILKMYEYFKDRMMFAPASGVVYYHNAFPGGYICHILNVTKFALEIFELYEKLGMHTSEYDKEAVIFCTLHHDLGKVGNLDYDYYKPNESEWHRINQGKMYDYDDRLHYMTVTDRSVWLLSQFDIKMSEIEYLALRLTDGMYEEANKGYYMGYGEAKNLKTNLPYLLHTADMLATRWEKEQYMFSKDSGIKYDEVLKPELKVEREQKEQESVSNIKKAISEDKTPEILSDKSKDLFNELFGDK
jgi:hypothetical protein